MDNEIDKRTDHELRVRMAEANGWTQCADGSWMETPISAQKFPHPPELSHWFGPCVIDLARKHCFLMPCGNDWYVLRVNHPPPELSRDWSIIVATGPNPYRVAAIAWLAVCHKVKA